MNKKSLKTLYKVGIVILLILVVVVVLIVRNKKPADNSIVDIVIDSSAAVDSVVKQDSLIQISEIDTTAAKPSQDDSLSGQAVPVLPEMVKETPSLPENTLAKVNDESITAAIFDSIFNSLPSQAKDYFKDDKAGFLEELIVRQLLLQDARRKKIQDTPEYKSAIVRNPVSTENIMINVLIKNLSAEIFLTEAELKEFFDQYKDQLPNKDYESVKEQIRPMALEEKQRVAIEDYISGLKFNAKIVRNQQWIKTQEALIADNPLNKALKSKKPVVADFGKGTCVPCKMMQPILEKLQREYAGRAEILILDVGEYASLSRKYRIQLIPTQIFFDADGKEVYRHQGFMPEDDIVAQLKKLRVQ